MPRAPKYCGRKGCTELVRGKPYCTEHGNGWKTSPRTASSRRTGTRAWRELRAKILQRDRHQCTVRGPRCTIKAVEVDHVVPCFLGGGDEPSNLQAVCHPCHVDRTTAQAQAARG